MNDIALFVGTVVANCKWTLKVNVKILMITQASQSDYRDTCGLPITRL